jgi:hypothetical protein
MNVHIYFSIYRTKFLNLLIAQDVCKYVRKKHTSHRYSEEGEETVQLTPNRLRHIGRYYVN